jgi:hypothetical protein
LDCAHEPTLVSNIAQMQQKYLMTANSLMSMAISEKANARSASREEIMLRHGCRVNAQDFATCNRLRTWSPR